MTLRARALGMSRTVFRNASGLPDARQVTTARDMAILADDLIQDFPEYYHYFSVRSFVFHGETISGHDPMLGIYPGADGLKTGYTNAAGHNLATSAVRDGTRLIGIILGAPTNARRDTEMIGLLDHAFNAADAAAKQPPDLLAQIPTLIPAANASNLDRPALLPAMARLPLVIPHAQQGREAPAMGYDVQIGSYFTLRSALGAVHRAVATVGGTARVDRFMVRGKPVWRSRVAGLSYAGAQRLCPAFSKREHRCAILPEQGK
jgi:D-alanyl-D-alanine carboxypeptidase